MLALESGGTYINVFGSRSTALHHSELGFTDITGILVLNGFSLGVTLAGVVGVRIVGNLQSPRFP